MENADEAGLSITKDPAPEPRLLRGDQREWSIAIVISLPRNGQAVIGVGAPPEVRRG